MRQYELDLMARFMETKSVNPKIKQNQIAEELTYPNSTLQRYRNDINMFSPYGIPPNNTNKRRQKSSDTIVDDNLNREHDLNERPQLTPKESSPDMVKPMKNKSKGGANIEIKYEFLDETL